MKSMIIRAVSAAVLSGTVILSAACGTAAAEGGVSGISETAEETGGASGTSETPAVTSDMVNIKDSDYETDWENENYVTVTADGGSAEADGAGVSVSSGVINITAEGTYVLKGSFEGTVRVDTGDGDAKVRLVLDGFSVTSSDGPAILALTADKVTVTTADGTENSVTDSAEYSDSDSDAAIMSRTDLVLNGGGSLSVTGKYKDAVHSTDDLRITGGTYVIDSADDGFVGKDRLEITDGTFTVTTEGETGDAFKSTNTEDEERGFIYIAGGTFDISSGDEAFQSAADLMVTGGTFDIAADGKGFHAGSTLEFDGGTVTVTASYEGLEAPVIVIRDGTFDITASDDGLNAAGGDTGDSEEESGTGDGPGNRAWGGMESTSTGYLYIYGGTIHVNSGGDGIDSNTSVTQTGGTVTVDGPTADMDGALDYGETYDMSGGYLFAAGSSGMLQTISDSSSVNCLSVLYSEEQAAGTTVTVRDGDGKTVAEFTSEKQFASFVLASEDLEAGAEYTVFGNGEKVCTVTLSGTVTMVDDSGNETTAGRGGFGGWNGGFGGQPGRSRNDGGMPPAGQNQDPAGENGAEGDADAEGETGAEGDKKSASL